MTAAPTKAPNNKTELISNASTWSLTKSIPIFSTVLSKAIVELTGSASKILGNNLKMTI